MACGIDLGLGLAVVDILSMNCPVLQANFVTAAPPCATTGVAFLLLPRWMLRMTFERSCWMHIDAFVA